MRCRPTRTISPTSDVDERLAFVALALTPGLGARRIAGLLSHHGSAPAALAATPGASLAAAHEHAVRCERAGATLLVPADAAYPARLRSIPDPPPLLHARGDLALVDRRAAAIVGSRDHTRYGEDVVRELASGLASIGVTVVSGMARGLDAAAHRAALDARGPTIGVLGNGLGVVYPAANRELYTAMERDGLLLTEHPPGERPRAGFFPRRNRLISGLADAVVVVEAARGSGTMVTVAMALEQGRDVMAVPGPITSPTSAGTNQLIRDGAESVLDVADLLAKFGATVEALPSATPPCTLSPAEAQAFDAITAEGRHVDELACRTGLPIGTLLSVLFGLELAGLVEQLPGSFFRRGRGRRRV